MVIASLFASSAYRKEMQSHRSDPHILSRRTLECDHTRLAELLRPGMAVLDVGCGTGAITAGIARAVGPTGNVVGVDRDEVLLELARSEHGAIPNLRFEPGDATSLNVQAQFDIVTAARVLQWIAEPALAIRKMAEAARPGGLIVVLDYNHNQNRWEPEPPPGFREFYQAFLRWRQDNGWDNDMADHLAALFESVGLTDIEVRPVEQPSSDTSIWSGVIDHVSKQLLQGGYCTEEQLSRANSITKTLGRQTLSMKTVTGTVDKQPVS